MYVEQHDVGVARNDAGDGIRDGAGFTDELEARAQLGADAREEGPVVVHEEHADPVVFHADRLGRRRWTSVPSAGLLAMAAVPPLRSIRPMIDSEMPRRSGAWSPTS